MRLEVKVGRPTTMNAHRRMHHQVRAEDDAMWRTAARMTVLSDVPPKLRQAWRLAEWRVEITVTPVLRKGEQDPGACYPSAKAAIDGVVDAGILKGDTRAHVAWIKLMPVERGSWDGLRLEIEPEEGEPSDDPDDSTNADPINRGGHAGDAGWRWRRAGAQPVRRVYTGGGPRLPPGDRRGA